MESRRPLEAHKSSNGDGSNYNYQCSGGKEEKGTFAVPLPPGEKQKVNGHGLMGPPQVPQNNHQSVSTTAPVAATGSGSGTSGRRSLRFSEDGKDGAR